MVKRSKRKRKEETPKESAWEKKVKEQIEKVTILSCVLDLDIIELNYLSILLMGVVGSCLRERNVQLDFLGNKEMLSGCSSFDLPGVNFLSLFTQFVHYRNEDCIIWANCVASLEAYPFRFSPGENPPL